MSCAEKNPLIREGTSTLTRMLAALSVSYAKPDERQPDDLLLFIQRYAAYLKYYDSTNQEKGDWSALMKVDISVTLAVLMKLNARKCADYKKLLYKKIQLDGTDDATAKTNFKYVFDLVFSLVTTVAQQYRLLPASFEYRQVIENIIIKKMLGPVVNLKNLFDDFNTNGLMNTGAGTDSAAPIITTSSMGFAVADLGSGWPLPAIVSGLSFQAFANPKQEIEYIINHNFFNAQVETILLAIASVADKATSLFNDTLKSFPSHSPHYALIITFVKLFGIAQDELNNYTQHHIDFYYKEVLQLANKRAEPDKAHLLFELQKPVSKHLLKKAELFKGGKDSVTGKELNYQLIEDIVLNKAAVEKIQSVQLLKKNKDILAASPVAVSEDGQGGKLVFADKSWFTFGNTSLMKEASIGFAIASNILFVNEGTRTITVTVNFVEGTTSFTQPLGTGSTEFFKGKLTGKKNWHDVIVNVQGSTAGDQLTFTITLGPTDPAIIPYTESIHKENIATDLPVLKIYLDQSFAASYPYRLLCRDRLKSIIIDVDVRGVKDLMLSNEKGSIDSAKPFKPFGEFPAAGASFYIGSKEIFQKNLAAISLEFGNVIPYNNIVEYLYDGDWVLNKAFESDNKTLLLAGEFPPAAVDYTANEPLSATTLAGFMRLSLNSTAFSMEQYLTDVTTQINNTTISKTSDANPTYKINTNGQVASPKELVLSGFSINYAASATIPFNNTNSNTNNRLLHLAPFGYYDVNYEANQNSKKITLIPEITNDGELYIGLSNTSPEEVVNILFQVAEGSSNPLRRPEEVEWYFLNVFNEWIEFESRHIIDRTNDFLQSGIVTITLPIAISDQATALQKGLYWIKAVVKQHADAVCKMILVQAQAAQVALVQDEEERIEFNQTLPAGTISKLVTSAAEIKSISQPYDSFGGRVREPDEHFYGRVSERLRHKQRAITIWDYEHIILEQFPQINKVRCINHAGFYTDNNDEEIFCENYPGHVTIITVPDFRNKSGIDPLKPYTPVGINDNIDAYLHKIISPFVKLHVTNPQFEEVQLEFDVTFHENLDEAFYRQLLAIEIERFLTPWAYDAKKEISFGGKIMKSTLLNFVEERSYVDFVTCFNMHHIIRRKGALHVAEKRNVEEAIPSTARSLLVSYSNEVTKETHLINSPAACEC